MILLRGVRIANHLLDLTLRVIAVIRWLCVNQTVAVTVTATVSARVVNRVIVLPPSFTCFSKKGEGGMKLLYEVDMCLITHMQGVQSRFLGVSDGSAAILHEVQESSRQFVNAMLLAPLQGVPRQ